MPSKNIAPRKKRRDFSKKTIPAPRKKRRDFSEKTIPAPGILLNIRNPEIDVPVLQPEIAVVKEKQAPTFIEKSIQTFSDWMNWLAESGQKYIVKLITSKLQNLKEKITKLFEDKEFEVREGQSALKNFVREKIIEGKPGYDPQSFFEATRNIILKILRENIGTKTKMILACKMEKIRFKIWKYYQH